MRMAPRLLTLLVLVALAGPAFAESLPAELEWIHTLPSATATARQDSDTHCDATYYLRAPEQAWSTIKRELPARGWVITSESNVGSGAMVTHSLIASKRRMTLRLSLQDSGSAGILAVSASRDAEPVVVAPPPPHHQPPGVEAGRSLVINENHASSSYQCDRTRVTLNGNHDALTFHGDCHQISVNGNNNELQVRAYTEDVTVNGNHNLILLHNRVHRITVNGNNNDVRWSAERNPRPPSVANNGNGNNVGRR